MDVQLTFGPLSGALPAKLLLAELWILWRNNLRWHPKYIKPDFNDNFFAVFVLAGPLREINVI